jgi:hypothetical protein
MAYWSFVKLYTVVVHYLQMCMKEYGCCPKFKRGDNSTYTFTKRGGHVPCKHNFRSCTYKVQGRTDRLYTPQTVCGGYKKVALDHFRFFLWQPSWTEFRSIGCNLEWGLSKILNNMSKLYYKLRHLQDP